MHTGACHLCEQAEALLQALDLAYVPCEITERVDWLERYDIRIPVLVLEDRELGWPFSANEVQAFVKPTQ